MSIKTFWLIVLKGIGLWLFVQCIYLIPNMISLFLIPQIDGWDDRIPTFIFSLTGIIVYVILANFFLFRPHVLILKLKLENSFAEDNLNINISKEAVLKIIVILIGALTFIDSFPNLVRDLFDFFRQKELLRTYPNLTWLVFHFLLSIIGYLFMTNSKIIVLYLVKQSEK